MELTIATRSSQLALCQTELVAQHLKTAFPELKLKILPLSTQGDRILDQPLAQIGGKGLFTQELEASLFAGEADLAVHSLKDVPAEMDERLALAAVLSREDPRDVFISTQYRELADLPSGARIGTASIRRKIQLLAYQPDLEVEVVRGNVGTRLAKLERENLAGIILAAAGIHRLKLALPHYQYLPTELFLPAICQGILAVQYLNSNQAVAEKINALQDPSTVFAARAERSLQAHLGANCQIPVAGNAEVKLAEDQIKLRGMLALESGEKTFYCTKSAKLEQAEQLGQAVGQELLQLCAQYRQTRR